jgi:DNA-binding MarR family transcriptional regulator
MRRPLSTDRLTIDKLLNKHIISNNIITILINYGDEMETLHVLLMKAQGMMYREILTGAAGLGLTPGQPKILEYLTEREGSDQKTIAAYCGIEQATAGSILGRMEKLGLVERRRPESDRRALNVYLTEHGRAAARRMAGLYEKAEAEAASALTPSEAEELRCLLEKMCVKQ